MKEINYLKGDATNPLGKDNKIIVHICNDIGGWGRGFVLAVSKKWKAPETAYKAWFKSKDNFTLGAVQFVNVEENLWVANLIGQRDIITHTNGQPPIRYDAVKQGLSTIAVFAKENNCSVHMPRIGCGLAGGKWESIEPLIIEELSSKNVETNVYDFE